MKGDELVAKVRGLVPDQRIIMVSGNWEKPGDPVAKVNLCLDKPVQLPELLTAVHLVLDKPIESVKEGKSGESFRACYAGTPGSPRDPP
jgi:hypothetical protein